MTSTVDFYFDFSSPNAYCALVQLRRLQDSYDFVIDLEPVFLGGILQELETTAPAMQNDLKAQYLRRDLERWTDFYDIPFSYPNSFPVNSLPALRTILALNDRDVSPGDYVHSTFHEHWGRGRDISEEGVLKSCLPDSVSLNEIRSQIESDNLKNELKTRTSEAMDRGVFGCPVMFVDGEPFWGKDRLQFVEERLS